jgi:prephenate dehydratase
MSEILTPGNQRIELSINDSLVQIELRPGRLTPKVGCLGPEGTYTEEARDLLLNGSEHHRIQKDFLQRNVEVVEKVDSGEYDIGIIPVENSIEGNVEDVWKTLIRTNNTRILAEAILPIQHMLIGRKHENILKVLSHEQALGQSRNFISRHYPQAKLQETTSTAKAVEEIKNLPNAAAIASRRVAQNHQMPILAENIGNNSSNATRFLLIGRGETEPTGDDITTAIIYPQENRVGILKDCLEVLVRNNINLTDIRSYPTAEQMGKYLFRMSFNGHQKDIPVLRALQTLKDICSAPSRILGSYKRAELPEGTLEPGMINGK